MNTNKNTKWWAKRWAERVTAKAEPGKLIRGEAHVHNGNVSIDVMRPGAIGGCVSTTNQRQMEQLVIRVPILSWYATQIAANELSTSAESRQQLARGEMPQRLTDKMIVAELDLFVRTYPELHSMCTCDDSEAPCRHVLAVHLSAADHFGQHPMDMMMVRGMEVQQLEQLIQTELAEAEAEAKADNTDENDLSMCPATFWGNNYQEIDIPQARAPTTPAPAIRRLGKFPDWAGSLPLSDILIPVAARASETALEQIARSRTAAGLPEEENQKTDNRQST